MRLDDIPKEITNLLYEAGVIKTWLKDRPQGWELHDKQWSPFYIQLRVINSLSNSKEILEKVGTAMGNMIKEVAPETTKIVGVALAGIPLAVAITMCSGIPSCYTRSFPETRESCDLDESIREINKKYGEPKLVEGKLQNKDNLVIVDDLVTSFNSKLIAKKLIDYETARRQITVTCDKVAVLFDREQGAAANAQHYGMDLFSLIPFHTKGMDWLKDKMSPKEYEVICDYLDKPEEYQDMSVRKELEEIAIEAKKATIEGGCQ